MSVAQCPPGFTVTGTGYIQGSMCGGGAVGSVAISGLAPWGDHVLAWPMDNYSYTVVAIAQCSN